MQTGKADPLVSVLIPTRNRAELMQETVQSVLAQRWRDFELVLSNNHSTDDTQQVLEKMAEQDSRIRLIAPPEPLGMTAHWNWAWKQTRGKYVAFLSDDDIWEPTFLQTVVALAEERPDLDIIATNYAYWYMDKEGLLETRSSVPSDIQGVVANPLEAMLKYNLIFLNSNLMRSSAFQDVAGFGPSYIGDFELWIKAALAEKKFFYVNEPHMKYRMHTSQMSQPVELTKMCAEMLERYLDFPGTTWSRRQRIRRATGGTWALVGKNARDAAHPAVPEPPLHYLFRGLKICPWHPVVWRGILSTLISKPTHNRGHA